MYIWIYCIKSKTGTTLELDIIFVIHVTICPLCIDTLTSLASTLNTCQVYNQNLTCEYSQPLQSQTRCIAPVPRPAWTPKAAELEHRRRHYYRRYDNCER